MLERIGSCRIVDEVASGGMAVVYRAVQDHLGRTVAIKALKSSVAIEESIMTRFEREAQSLANLQHENIIHIYDFYKEQGSLFIVMEFVEGIDLYDLLDRAGRVPYDVAAVVAMQVARALDYIHYRSIIHRDIKPANVMLSRQGGVKLMDFGIARDKNFGDLTETGTGLGTPAYMSPEQILGDKLDARSDIFSLGIVLYQMLTGKKPFVEDETRSVMQKIRLERHVRCRKLNPDIPRELDHIVDRCLQKQPRERYQSAQQLVMALERFLAKHVEINYHARLVLFLRNQNVISQLEAEEYLSPAIGGGRGAPLVAPNVQAKHTLRRAGIVHASVLGFLAMMLGFIHMLASSSVHGALARGYVRISAYPWATISIDGTSYGVTPQVEAIELSAGSHQVVLEHDYYAPIERTIDVVAGRAQDAISLAVDFEASGNLKAGKAMPRTAGATPQLPLPAPGVVPTAGDPTAGDPAAPGQEAAAPDEAAAPSDEGATAAPSEGTPR